MSDLKNGFKSLGKAQVHDSAPVQMTGSVLMSIIIACAAASIVLPAVGLFVLKAFSFITYAKMVFVGAVICAVACVLIPTAKLFAKFEKQDGMKALILSLIFVPCIGFATIYGAADAISEKNSTELFEVNEQLTQWEEKLGSETDANNLSDEDKATLQALLKRSEELEAAGGDVKPGSIIAVLGIDFVVCIALLSFCNTVAKNMNSAILGENAEGDAAAVQEADTTEAEAEVDDAKLVNIAANAAIRDTHDGDNNDDNDGDNQVTAGAAAAIWDDDEDYRF